jgi:hypothetical protein
MISGTAGGSFAPQFDQIFLEKLEYLSIVSKKVFAGRMRAERVSRKAGAGIEFADHRDYAAGDDFRYLDWNVYGRSSKLLVRLFEEEEDLHVYLLLDASASMGTGRPPKIAYAMQIAAALGYVALANLDPTWIGWRSCPSGERPCAPICRRRAARGGSSRSSSSCGPCPRRAPPDWKRSRAPSSIGKRGAGWSCC